MKRFLFAAFATFAIVSPSLASDNPGGGNGEGVSPTIQEQIEMLGVTNFTITQRASDGRLVADGGAEMAGLNTGFDGGE